MKLQDFFAEEGLISKKLSNYEIRNEQVQMAEIVSRCITKNQHLLIEAGTGVGKSFAYIIPLFLWLLDDSSPGRKCAVISTNTIALQEQLINKDVPFIKEISNTDFKVVLAKGRSNYLCIRRLELAVKKQDTLFDIDSESEELGRIVQWSYNTTYGDKAELDFNPSNWIWNQVCSDKHKCIGKNCIYNRTCKFHKSRNRLYNSDLIITNHHLYLNDLIMKEQGSQILPDHDVLVLDEAHTLEDVASNQLGIKVSNTHVKYLLNLLYNETHRSGMLRQYDQTEAIELCKKAKSASENMYDGIREWIKNNNIKESFKLNSKLEIDPELCFLLDDLYAEIKKLAYGLESEDEAAEVMGYGESIYECVCNIRAIINQQNDNFVYWVEWSEKSETKWISLMGAPIYVGTILHDMLYSDKVSTISTSATLSSSGNFNYFASRVGYPDDREEAILGSPFNFKENVTLYLHKDMSDPKNVKYKNALIHNVKKYLLQTKGRAFILFTNYKLMNEIYLEMQNYFKEHNFVVMIQGDKLNRAQMLNKFREEKDSILFGTASFWEGVDVQGEALSNVIITKLPFSVPNHPLTKARLEDIEKKGGNSFVQYLVPEAIIRFRQGFGRLIRTKEDTGIVVVLDQRILTKQYGKMFLNSIPECKIEII